MLKLTMIYRCVDTWTSHIPRPADIGHRQILPAERRFVQVAASLDDMSYIERLPVAEWSALEAMLLDLRCGKLGDCSRRQCPAVHRRDLTVCLKHRIRSQSPSHTRPRQKKVASGQNKSLVRLDALTKAKQERWG